MAEEDDPQSWGMGPRLESCTSQVGIELEGLRRALGVVCELEEELSGVCDRGWGLHHRWGGDIKHAASVGALT